MVGFKARWCSTCILIGYMHPYWMRILIGCEVERCPRFPAFAHTHEMKKGSPLRKLLMAGAATLAVLSPAAGIATAHADANPSPQTHAGQAGGDDCCSPGGEAVGAGSS